MKIVFFGTPDFSVYPLKKLVGSGYDIAAVVTVPDKPQGRGLKLKYSAVKEFALESGIPVLQPESLKSLEFEEELKKVNASLFIVVAFKILPPNIFNLPEHGSFNLHGSLLPKYRGAAPIQWALINGDKLTGLTTFRLAEKVDTGNIYLRKEIVVNDDDDFASLYYRMAENGADLVIDTVELIKSGKFDLLPQNNSTATPAPKITKEMCEIDFNNDVLKIHNLIRGLSPVPGAFFTHGGKSIKIYKSKINNEISLNPGELKNYSGKFLAGCKDGSLEILELQQEGKKRMIADEFLRGFRF